MSQIAKAISPPLFLLWYSAITVVKNHLKSNKKKKKGAMLEKISFFINITKHDFIIVMIVKVFSFLSYSSNKA
jgi:hypothetical protein